MSGSQIAKPVSHLFFQILVLGKPSTVIGLQLQLFINL